MQIPSYFLQMQLLNSSDESPVLSTLICFGLAYVLVTAGKHPNNFR